MGRVRTEFDREKARVKYSNQYHNDPVFKLKELLKKRAIKILKRNVWYLSEGADVKLFGMPYDEIKLFIEDKFKPGMSWDNHGVGLDCWHIDHIIPLDSAKTVEDVYPLFHYTNIQPLWSIENIRKSNKVNGVSPVKIIPKKHILGTRNILIKPGFELSDCWY